MALSKEFLTGGTGDGRNIKVVAVATAGTVIHTVPAGAKDTIALYGYNSDSVPRTVTIEFGGVATPDDLIETELLPDVETLILSGRLLGAGLVIGAFVVGAANVVMVGGDVSRVT